MGGALARTGVTCDTDSMGSLPRPAPPPTAPYAAAAEPALVRRFPALAALPRAPFLPGPTPVEPLPLPDLPAGTAFVKRDDQSCPLYGGNKPRKLEFVMGAALARASRRLVTAGGIGTHHGLATTILARERSLATTVVVVPQPPTDHVREQLAAMLAFGAELRFARGVPGAAAHTVRALAAATWHGERPVLVPAGGSSALGDVGFVSAAFELAEQIEAGLLPEPAEIYVPLGSGGTLSGLALGARLSGLRSSVVGVLVNDILPPTQRRVMRLAAGTLALLRRFAPELPARALAPHDFEITRAQLGPGYGVATEAGRAAAASCSGLRLDLVYTAKCMAEVLARVRAGRARTPLLFWNTYNSVDFWAHAPARPSLEELPAPLRSWLARAETV
jgi:D-cysteine desulfhydrase